MDSDAWLTLPDAWLTPIAILSASCFGIICSIFWSGQHFRGEIAHTPPAESKRIIEQFSGKLSVCHPNTPLLLYALTAAAVILVVLWIAFGR
jgi:hypothetical protein